MCFVRHYLAALGRPWRRRGRGRVRRRTARGGSGGAGESLRGSLKRSAVSGRSLRASVATPQAAAGQVCSPNKVCSRQRCTGWVRRLCTRASTVFVFTKCLSGVFSEKIKFSTKNKISKVLSDLKKSLSTNFFGGSTSFFGGSTSFFGASTNFLVLSRCRREFFFSRDEILDKHLLP